LKKASFLTINFVALPRPTTPVRFRREFPYPAILTLWEALWTAEANGYGPGHTTTPLCVLQGIPVWFTWPGIHHKGTKGLFGNGFILQRKNVIF